MKTKLENIKYFKDYIVYGEDIDQSVDEGCRAPYFYLHNSIEDINGFDICNVSVRLLIDLLRPGVKFAWFKKNEQTYPCLVICSFNGIQTEGYIVHVNDYEGILDAALEFKPTIVNDSHYRLINQEYPGIIDLIEEISRSGLDEWGREPQTQINIG